MSGEAMDIFLVVTGVVIGVLILIGIVRIALGPTLFDRVLASSLVAVNGLLLLLVVAFLIDRVDMFVDLAIAFALLGFLVPLAAGRIVGKREQQ